MIHFSRHYQGRWASTFIVHFLGMSVGDKFVTLPMNEKCGASYFFYLIYIPESLTDCKGRNFSSQSSLFFYNFSNAFEWRH
jgi:hypothetical protein